MFTKTLVTALVVASTAFALASQVNAGPAKPQTPANQEHSWMDRASTNYDGGGY